jgi:Skp family chaperone for outer membrane proteins
MHAMTRPPVAAALTCALLAGAMLTRLAPQPARIATVRIEALFEKLQQRADAKAEIEAMDRRITNEKTRREDAIKALERDLATAAPAAQAPLEDDIAMKKLQLTFWLKEAVAELEVEKAIRLQDLYRSIARAARELAEAEAYDLVLLDDRLEADAPLFKRDASVPAQVQVLQQITTAKLLYAADPVDITEDLIARMDNAFRAGPHDAGP